MPPSPLEIIQKFKGYIKPTKAKNLGGFLFIYMDTKPLTYKRISNDDTVFFVFKVNNNLILYDSGMGYVIQQGYGPENKIFNILSKEISRAKNKKRKQFKVFWLVIDSSEGWKITTTTRAGYSNDRDGKVDGLPRPEKNDPNIKQVNRTKIAESAEETFYWFDLGNGTHVLYDSDMGTPVSYGSVGFIKKTLDIRDRFVREGKSKEYILWYFQRKDDGMWGKKQSPRIPNWKIDSTDKKEATDKKNKE